MQSNILVTDVHVKMIGPYSNTWHKGAILNNLYFTTVRRICSNIAV